MENDAVYSSSVVVFVFTATVTILASHCLAMIRGSLPSHCQATRGGYTQTHRLMRGVYEVHHSDELWWHDIYTRFHKIHSGIQKLIGGIKR
jgi:hypothetical protein